MKSIFLLLSILICNYIYHLRFSEVNGNGIVEPKAVAQAPEGEGCPRCGGFVYAAEQMLARGRVSAYNFSHQYI